MRVRVFFEGEGTCERGRGLGGGCHALGGCKVNLLIRPHTSSKDSEDEGGGEDGEGEGGRGGVSRSLGGGGCGETWYQSILCAEAASEKGAEFEVGVYSRIYYFEHLRAPSI